MPHPHLQVIISKFLDKRLPTGRFLLPFIWPIDIFEAGGEVISFLRSHFLLVFCIDRNFEHKARVRTLTIIGQRSTMFLGQALG